MACPPPIAASRTVSSSSAKTLVRNVDTSGRSLAVSDAAAAPSARTIAARPAGSPTSCVASSPGNCGRRFDAKGSSPSVSSGFFGDAAENAAKSLARTGATPAPPPSAATDAANAPTAAFLTEAAP